MTNDEHTKHYIEHQERVVIPRQLDAKYGYLLSNGYYNYQEYINHLSERAQQGDSEALETCLYYFGWRGAGAPEQIFGEFYYLLTSASIDIGQPHLMAFIRLFSKENEREVLKSRHTSHRKNNLAVKKLDGIVNRLSWKRTAEEIKEDLLELIIDRVLKYKQGDRSLRKYMYEMFHLYVADYVQGVFRERDYYRIPYSRVDMDLEEIPDESIEFPVNLTTDDAFYEWEKSQNDLGIYWAQGHTHPLFQVLTTGERAMLRDNYFYGIPEHEVASDYGVSRNTVNNRNRASREKLRKEIDNQDIWLNTILGYETFDINAHKKREAD